MTTAMRGRRGLVAAAFMALAALPGCGGGGGGGTDPGGGDAPPLQLTTPGVAVVKLRSQGAGWAALTEKPRTLEIPTAPDRQLLRSRPDGRATGSSYQPPAGWSLLDFALHPVVAFANHHSRFPSGSSYCC